MANLRSNQFDPTNKNADGHNAAEAEQEPSPYVPRTPLGRDLMAIRARIVASGQPLLDWDEIEREVVERRGGVTSD